ncbi:MAG: hypothetical protein HY898_24035 [Deltaproteobacteria bacterium]|nr:hypothetical protein [Deltaproteobacteria bacterium]
MKTFSFIAGNKADASQGMKLHVNRSLVPNHMHVGVWLDDDGKAFPHIVRPATERLARAGTAAADFVLLNRAQVATTLRGVEGVLTIEPGTRFDAGRGGELGEIKAFGAEIQTKLGRRFALIQTPKAVLTIDKQPHDFHVFTIEGKKPAGAKPGQQYRVDIAQENSKGVVVGGLTVIFTFD